MDVMMRRGAWLIGPCLALSGCLSIGHAELAGDQTMAGIRVGETTREQVLNVLGEPDSQMLIDIRGSQREWWSYTYASAVVNPIDYMLLYGLFFNGIGMYDTRYDVGVFFDHRGVVSSVSRLTTDYEMGGPFASLHVSSISDKTIAFSEPAKQSVHYEDRMEFQQ